MHNIYTINIYYKILYFFIIKIEILFIMKTGANTDFFTCMEKN